MGDEAEDLSLVDEAKEEIEAITGEIASMKLSTLLTGEYDKNNAILTFHAGSGGTEPRTGPRCSSACTTVGRSATL